LESEIWAQTGRNFKIFQDQENIAWGDDWKERIKRSLEASTLLIAIITPSYLTSESCRFEFEYFLNKEETFKKKLVLPIHYIETPSLSITNDDKIAFEISKRQWVDWRNLRFATLSSIKVKKRIEFLAKQIRDLIEEQPLTVMPSNRPTKYSFPNSTIRNDKTEISPRPNLAATIRMPLSKSVIDPRITDSKTTEREPLQITIALQATGEKDRDRRRIKVVYGTLISFHGNDRFSFQILDNDTAHLIDFPTDTTRICPELINRLRIVLGEETWSIEPIVYQ